MLKNFSWLWQDNCCLPAHHSLANSFHSCTNIWAKTTPPLFGCLPPSSPLSSLLLQEPKWLPQKGKKRKKSIMQLEVVYVGDVDRGCWQKLHLICYWFIFIITSCYQETIWLLIYYLLCVISGTLLEMNSYPNWSLLLTVLFCTNMTKEHHVDTKSDLLHCTFLIIIFFFPSSILLFIFGFYSAR